MGPGLRIGLHLFFNYKIEICLYLIRSYKNVLLNWIQNFLN